jgi:hypothetical protein
MTTFDELERSRWFGQPIAFLRLSRGALTELYTSADREITIGDDTYLPLAITRSEIQDSAERAKGVLTITMPIDAPCVSWWRPYAPSSTIGVTWLAMHRGSSDIVVEWVGRVIGPKYSDSTLTLSCEPTKTNARSRGLELRWQRGCPLAVYSQGLGMCNLNPDDFAVPGTVEDFSGLSLQASAFSSATFALAGGYITWVREDGETETRSIMAHTLGSDVIVLNYGTDTLTDGMDVIAYPGCPHNWQACVDRGNSDNYGGSLYLPNKDPFNGNPV